MSRLEERDKAMLMRVKKCKGIPQKMWGAIVRPNYWDRAWRYWCCGEYRVTDGEELEKINLDLAMR